MKYRVLLALALIACFVGTVALAHSGRTDSSGGHYNRSTGEYHYHHGYSAHDHPGGVCPYKPKPTATPAPVKFNTLAVKATSTPAPVPNPAQSVVPYIPVVGGTLLLIIIALIYWICKLYRDLRGFDNTLNSAKVRERMLNDKIEEVETQLKARDAEIALRRDHLEAAFRERDLYVENVMRQCQVISALKETAQRERLKSQELQNEVADLTQKLDVLELSQYSTTSELSVLRKTLGTTRERYDELYQAWENHLMAESKNASMPHEALVYVNSQHKSKFHLYIHGKWSGYKIMPLSMAMKEGYAPCEICMGSAPKEWRK